MWHSEFSQDTLEDLVKLTQKHLDEAVSLPWALAQRSSIDLNIEASIQLVASMEHIRFTSTKI